LGNHYNRKLVNNALGRLALAEAETAEPPKSRSGFRITKDPLVILGLLILLAGIA